MEESKKSEKIHESEYAEDTFKVLVTRDRKSVVRVELVSDKEKEEREEKEKNGKDQVLSFGVISYNWFQLCLGLFEAFPVYRKVARALHVDRADSKLATDIERLALSFIEQKDDENNEFSRIYSIRRQHIYQVSKEIIRLNQYKRAENAISRAQLLSLVAEYEAFIGDLLRLVIRESPRTFISQDSTIKASEVIEKKSIDDIKASIVESRIESIQRESHVFQLKMIYEKLNIPTPDTTSMKEFAEVCERRNMLTHADGKVNQLYRDNLIKLGVKSDSLPPIGQNLDIDAHYMRRSIARVFLMGYFTLHIVWQKVRVDEKEKSVSMLINQSHDFLVAGYTKMAKRICDFILNKKSPATELDRAYAVINKALADFLDKDMSNEEKREAIDETLSQRDWSIVDAKFDLALCCLREEYDRLPYLIDACVNDGLEIDAFLTWALFTKVRELEIFKEKVKEHFNVDVEVLDFSSKE